MNIFSNIGITELIVILLLALLVVGPERLPEMGRKLATLLRDIRKAYDNLTSELGPELTSIQKTTQELRDSVSSVRSIPNDVVKSVVKAADLDDTVEELKGMTSEIGRIGQTLSDAQKAVKDPVKVVRTAAQDALTPTKPEQQEEEIEEAQDLEDSPPAEQAP
jgi:sec-independent protein translocase protein TatB